MPANYWDGRNTYKVPIPRSPYDDCLAVIRDVEAACAGFVEYGAAVSVALTEARKRIEEGRHAR